MRNLSIIIDRIVEHIPEFGYDRLRHRLESIKSSSIYAAPEMQSFWWGEVARELSYELGTEMNDWKNKIADIFSGKEEVVVANDPPEPEKLKSFVVRMKCIVYTNVYVENCTKEQAQNDPWNYLVDEEIIDQIDHEILSVEEN